MMQGVQGMDDNVCVYLKNRATVSRQHHILYSPKGRERLARVVASRLPCTMQERPILLEGYDKIFTSHWINEHQVVVGTKCNKVLLVNTSGSRRIIEIPYLSLTNEKGSPRPPTLQPPHSLLGHGGARRGHAHNLSISSVSSTSSSSSMFSDQPEASYPLPACVGIHSIEVSPSKTHLAVASGKPYEVIVYSLPSIEPLCILTGHTDLVFSVAFVTDDLLVTASRDGTVGVFSLRSEPSSHLDTGACGPLPVLRPITIRREHTNKVRDLKYNPDSKQIVTLGSDGTVKVWDSQSMHVVSTTPLLFAAETVCLGMDRSRGLYSIGSQAHVTLLDARQGRLVHHFESVDEGWGVRSLAHNQHILACGGGMGRLSFYDLKAMEYVTVPRHSRPAHTSQPSSAQGSAGSSAAVTPQMSAIDLDARTSYTGSSPVLGGGRDRSDAGMAKYHESSADAGYLNRDPVYMSHFQGVPIQNALYTLSYSDDYSRLFTGGGPLQLGLCGSYGAVW